MRQQQGLKKQDDGADRRHGRRAEKKGAEAGTGRVRATAGDRRQLQRRKYEGKGCGNAEQHALLRVGCDALSN